MQRRRLLLAICEVVGQDGLEAASVGRVCEQAGVSRRTFYEIFEDREACLLAAFGAQAQRIGVLLAPVYDGRGRWEERVRGALCLLLEHFDAEPDIARLCVVETLRAGPTVLERRRQLLEALALAVDEGRDASRTENGLSALTAQGIVGGALSVIHARLLAHQPVPADDKPISTGSARADDRPTSTQRNPADVRLVDLTGPLMAMIVHPYLGATAARKQLERPAPSAPQPAPRISPDPFKGLPIRFTYRTARVLSTIATEARRGSRPSNRFIADASGINDDGQMSRLLGRLHRSGLIENTGQGHAKGEPNAWTLTQRGKAIHDAITVNGATR